MKKIGLTLIFAHTLFGCIENFDFETQNFEGVLVVDARLSDEEKKHEVLLSRARSFEQENLSAELGADVKVIDDMGNEYMFDEIDPGRYVSKVAFGASQDKSYFLRITTSNGAIYSSRAVSPPEPTRIQDLYVIRDRDGFREEGVSIKINTDDKSNAISYYRYEYEETYKIIAPFWNPFDFDIIDDLWFATDLNDFDGFEVGIKLKEQEERVCYSTNLSTEIIQTSTTDLTENIISDFEVRFISRQNTIISHRYSILVKQYRQSKEAFSYYQSLSDFSTNDDVFSEIQPGFLEGNISSDTDINEKVLGYFEVASTDVKRLFFDYSDMFPNEELPPYFINCEPVDEPLLVIPSANGVRSPLIDAIRNGQIKYHATNEEFSDMGLSSDRGPYFAKARACGDCTVWGSNEVPSFWIE